MSERDWFAQNAAKTSAPTDPGRSTIEWEGRCKGLDAVAAQVVR